MVRVFGVSRGPSVVGALSMEERIRRLLDFRIAFLAALRSARRAIQRQRSEITLF